MKSPLKMVTDLTSRLDGAKSALADLHAADKELKTTHAAAAAELSGLGNARPPLEEMIAEGERQIDAQAAPWSEAHGLELIDAIRSGTLDASAIPTAAAEKKRDLRAALELYAYTPGPPTREVPRLTAELVEKIKDIEAQHSELVERAAELGIALELLPDVRMRRGHEAHLAGLRERDRPRK